MERTVAPAVRGVAAALLFAVCAGACVVPLPSPAPAAERPDGDERAEGCAGTEGQQVVELVNAIRAGEGLAPLVADRRVAAAAQAHARDQAAMGKMTHVGSGGSTPADRVEAAGYDWARVEENVAAGQRSAAAVVSAWMGSARHRGTILSPDITHVGVGYVRDPGSALVHFWTMNVAAPRRPDTSGEVSCHP